MRQYCDYKRANRALVALLKTLRCSHDDTTSFLLRVYHSAEPRCVLCAISKCPPSHGILQCPWQSHREDEDVLPLMERCRKLYCMYLGVLHYLRTQQDRFEDTALVWQGFLFIIYMYIWLICILIQYLLSGNKNLNICKIQNVYRLHVVHDIRKKNHTYENCKHKLFVY